MTTRIKICGLTRPEDAAAAAGLGAWALGVIFAPESPRRVSQEQAAAVLGAAPSGVERIGVFVNAEPDRMAAAAKACGLTALQLHGDETPDECRQARRRTGLPVIKAVRVAGPDDIDGVVQFDTDYILLDTYHPERRGGTGESFDWKLAAGLPRETRAVRIILSGGLSPDNAVEAVRAVGPYALDASSGVETSPGIKDKELMERLFEQVKRATG